MFLLFFTIVNDASMNIHIQDFTWTYVSLLLGVYLEAELLGHVVAAAAAKSLQLCLTLCDPIDSSLPGPALPGVLQASHLESFHHRRKVYQATFPRASISSCILSSPMPFRVLYQ